MTAPRHVFRTYVRATPDAVWAAITAPGFLEQTAPPGAVATSVEHADPPRRLVVTWRVLRDAGADEPPSRVEWELTPGADGITCITTVHRDLGRSPRSSAAAGRWWPWALGSLTALLATGVPFPGTVPVAGPPDDDTSDADDEGELHRRLAVDANNSSWELLDRWATLTPDEADDLLGRAHAAAHHWRRAAGATPANAARASWLVSRASATVGHGDAALHHADRCLARCAEAGLVDFDLAYAREARARALACLGRHDEAAVELAAARAVTIADPEDAAAVAADLAAGPWFGLRT